MRRVQGMLSATVLLFSMVTVGWGTGMAGAQEATPPAPGFEIAPGVMAEALAFVPGQNVPSLYRITIDPGVTYAFEPSPEITLVYGESGSLVVTLDAPVTVFHAVDAGQPGEAIDAGRDFRLDVGDYVVFPPLVDGEVTNAGKEPASALAAAIVPMPVPETAPATPMP